MKLIRNFLVLGLLTVLLISQNFAIATQHKPTQAEIDAAKKIEAAKKKLTNSATKKLNTAKNDLRKLTSIATEANRKFMLAQEELRISISNKITADKNYVYARAAVGEAHDDIGRLAISAYTKGGSLSDLEMVLHSSGPQELIDRLTTLDNLGKRNKAALQRFKAAEVIAQSAKVAAEQAQAKQVAATAAVEVAKTRAYAAKAEQQMEVAKLQAVQDKLARELASAKRVRITLEQRRQLALLEENRAQTADRTVVTTKVWKIGGPTGKSTSRTTLAQRLKAVEFAKRQVLANKPYVWGDEGPNAFDCSGLVYAAYRHAGLGWPNWDRLNASLYYRYTKQIPYEQMEPGDLIFYSYNGSIAAIHHMSIYAGSGMMWEARSTKSGLRYSSINSVKGMMPYVGRV